MQQTFLKLILLLGAQGILTSCHSGANTTTSTSNQQAQLNNPLSHYFSLLKHTHVGQQNINRGKLQSSLGNQQSFYTNSATTIASMTVKWYSDNSCTTAISGGSFTFEGPYTTTADTTYYTSDQANYYTCQNGYPGGCGQMYADLVSSVQFTYNYVGGGSLQAPCMYGVGGSGGVNSIAVSLDGNIYAGTYGSNSVYKSDLNSIWTRIGNDSMPDDGSVTSVAIDVTGNNVYAGTNNGDVYMAAESDGVWALVNGEIIRDGIANP